MISRYLLLGPFFTKNKALKKFYSNVQVFNAIYYKLRLAQSCQAFPDPVTFIGLVMPNLYCLAVMKERKDSFG